MSRDLVHRRGYTELVEALGTTAMQKTHSSAGWFLHLGGFPCLVQRHLKYKQDWPFSLLNKTLVTLNSRPTNCSVTRFVAANDWA